MKGFNASAGAGIALLACVLPAAHAQSSVTIYGTLDSALSRIIASGAGRRSGLSSGASFPSRLGVSGLEDLGGGLQASFLLESSIFGDDGNASGLKFDRRSTVSLNQTGLGEIRLGRDYAPTWRSSNAFDPMGARGIGGNLSINNLIAASAYPGGISGPVARNNNSIGYFSPSFWGGLYAELQYAFGEQLSTAAASKTGHYAGGRLGYNAGPLQVAGSYGRFTQVNPAATALGERGDLTLANIGAGYDFGFVRLTAFYGQERLEPSGGGADTQFNSMFVGAIVPIGVHEVRASYGRYDRKGSDNDFDKLALRYSYRLSKRTLVYATVARLDNQGASARSLSVTDGLSALSGVRPGGSSSGYDIGIRHDF